MSLNHCWSLPKVWIRGVTEVGPFMDPQYRDFCMEDTEVNQKRALLISAVFVFFDFVLSGFSQFMLDEAF
jgi:hypothetical protein